jgi:TetR/AcrR family transcriptional repressor of nem operon
MAETVATSARERILIAALRIIRDKGYEATSVDDLCHAAGLTKGGFFHHFASKEALAIAAADYFGRRADGLFRAAPYQQIADPLQRLLGYIDFRIDMLRGAIAQFTCLLGTMVQETYASHPDIRVACERNIGLNAALVARDISAAKERYKPDAEWSAESLAFHTQAVIQGSFILAKAQGGPAIAADSLRHLRRYIELLFQPEPPV